MIPALMMTTVDSSTARLINKSEAAKKPEDITKSEKKIREAAQGFERTLLRQMLSVARNSNISGTETKSSMSMAYLQMMDDQLADLLSKTKKILVENHSHRYQMVQQRLNENYMAARF